MSSAEEDYNDNEDGNSPTGDEARNKKRKVQRACDVCRRKKIRCMPPTAAERRNVALTNARTGDGGQMPNNRCSNCIAYSFDCTYVEAAKKRGPPKGYVESLENRLDKMEKLLQRLCPDADFTQELGGQIDREAWMLSDRQKDGPSKRSASKSATAPIRPNTALCQQHKSQYQSPSTNVEDSLVPSDDERMLVRLGDKPLQRPPVVDKRFHGKSSGVMLVQAAVDFKREYSGIDIFKDSLPASRRAEFWTPSPWEFRHERKVEEQHHDFNLPPPDLLEKLVDVYFAKINIYLPLLHRGLFQQQLREGLHTEDDHFTAIVLLVCACSARFINDERVLLEPDQLHSAGWKYFEQVEPFRRFKISAPRLFDLQIQVLSVMFLAGTSSPHASWTIVGIGIRMAQDVGAHRNKVYKDKPNLDDELWKRAFWILVSLDRTTSASFGRPCAIQDEDFDLDLPLEVDDDCWDLTPPDHPLKHPQPPGRPSVVAFFVCHMKLSQILAFALRTIYSINKSKILLGFVGPQWEQHIVAELDSALNKWIDSVPDHLRWDPGREDVRWFDQSALLYCAYYHLQILIHRPFIPSPKKPSPLSFPSLAICTNAARSCSHVLDTQMRRSNVVMPWQCVSAFTSGIVLLLNIWGVKKSATSPDAASQMQDVHKCMNVLSQVEKRWHAAGRLWDILCELASVRDFPLPGPGCADALPSGKREREKENPSDTPSSTASSVPSPPSTGQAPVPRPIAKGRSIIAQRQGSSTMSSSASPAAAQSAPPNPPFGGADSIFPHGLPMATSELAQAPMHPMYNSYTFPQTSTTDFNPDSVNWLPSEAEQLLPSLDLGSMTFPDSAFGSMDSTNILMNGLNALAMQQQQQAPQLQQQQQQAPQLHHFPMGNTVDGSFSAPKPPNTVADLQLESMNMWSNAPTTWEWEDWSAYIGGGQPLQQTSHSQQQSGQHSQQHSQS
ncbi:hypothetical protein EXIGLDRAFT_748493 [Exidia glandulosa HHB12029]|uniref:Zn(2)-C6 fungal-type domain-containing protein n=1 Tax=Exidia glandulosa HHB12029 TaxID=1314781 RepID=A0A165JE29_EXIGL|nr:hypothetical protein EXIGLDRAFT_748493 [Exidia glandulosa HHB12029]